MMHSDDTASASALRRPARRSGRAIARAGALAGKRLRRLSTTGLMLAGLLGGLDRASAAEPEEDSPIDIDAAAEAGGAEAPEEETAPDAEATDEANAEAPKPHHKSPLLLSWYGSLESDVGFARYNAEDESVSDGTFQDDRGRFVVGPMLHVDIGSLFFEATGQFVAWIKNDVGNPLIAADDVWGKIGKLDNWDIQVGRFEAWHVYQKFSVRPHDLGPEFHSRGIGESAGAFDLFTLEDTGALRAFPVASQQFYVDIYEVSHILLREEAGSLAFHYFPLKNLGFEVHGKYGEQAQQNQLGVRAAAIWRPIRELQLSAAGEYRTQRRGDPPRTPDAANPGQYVECSDCGRVDRRGIGGGAVVFLGPIEAAINAATSIEDGYNDVTGKPVGERSPEVTSIGGYAQVTLGETSIGGAVNHTQSLDRSDNFQTHLQTAGYIFQPLSDDLSIKLVVTYATGEDDPFNTRNEREPLSNSFLGARIRLKYFFNTL